MSLNPGLAWLAAIVLLGGCASLRAPTDIIAGESLSGRLTVRVDATPSTDARNVTATFELQGNADQGRLDLSTPLGTTLARARWAPGRVALVTPQGETRFADLDELTHEVLGESVPVAALFDWLSGRPWPGADSAPTTPPAEPGFVQLGWVVSLARFGEGWVAARREQVPVVTVRAKLDRP
ncbi:outer membrane lipoprotein LolB [Piscinibacter sp.]|uniref:outer membrane lipoprotein LolB n=1 Tax=Piscinibacter sp. TaxID=1903157 RepID=UPI003559A8E0